MHPIEIVLIKFSEVHTLESYSNKIEQRYTIDNANEMYYNLFPFAQKLYPPIFEHGFLPFINDHLFGYNPPPPS